MKQRVTISISKSVLTYLDQSAEERGTSRSQVIESFIEESQQRKREEALAEQAKKFFSAEETEEEAAERADWLPMSQETQKSDAD